MSKVPTTRAIRALRDAGVEFDTHPYRYDGGGAAGAAEALGVPVGLVVKTLVFVGEDPVLVLMGGDREVSAKALARHLGTKRAEPASTRDAERLTGYRVGGISPLGTRTALPTVCHDTVLEAGRVYVNGGRRGLLVSLDPGVLVDVLDATVADVAT